jgi:hypothetical protein
MHPASQPASQTALISSLFFKNELKINLYRSEVFNRIISQGFMLRNEIGSNPIVDMGLKLKMTLHTQRKKTLPSFRSFVTHSIFVLTISCASKSTVWIP